MNVIKTAPVDEPITLNDVRAILGINQVSDTARDNVISLRIIAARRWAEQYMRRAVMPQTWLTYLDCFEDSINLLAGLRTVTSVSYYDAADVLQVLASTTYVVDTVKSRIVLASNKSWPEIYPKPNAIIIEYVTGYASDDDVPQDIKEALKFLVSHWENYQSAIEGSRLSTVPYAVEQLLNPYRDMREHF